MIVSLNRSAIVVYPTKKLRDWMESLEGQKMPETLDEEPTAYLIDEQDDTDPLDALEGHWREIADIELQGWWEDDADWPDIRGLKDFLEYFACSYSEIVHDLSKKKLVREEF